MTPSCRLCASALNRVVIDLGMSPLSNGYLRPEDALSPEVFYPLRVFVCDNCRLMQLPEAARRETIFGADYAYFSSYSTSWLEHCERYATKMIERFGLGSKSLVLEIASNDGYLLQYFKRAGIRVLGVEPSASVAEVAMRERGIASEVCFFGVDSAMKLRQRDVKADLICGNNVLAHVPDLRDFIGGIPQVLADHGIVTFEFPHLLSLLQEGQFDTIYQEHYSYLSLYTVQRALEMHELRVFDVEQLETHGGSLRVYACRKSDRRETTPAVDALARLEATAKLHDTSTYASLAQRAGRIKADLLEFLIKAKRDKKKIAGYGAPAKGNTLLNYCGIRADFIDFTVDRNPHKQGLLLPGTHIEVRDPSALAQERPDYILILPWNLRPEIAAQLQYAREWGARLVIAIPRLELFSP